MLRIFRDHPYVMSVIVIGASLLLRFAAFPVVTPDYTGFLLPWYETLKSTPGLSAFSTNFSDYAPLYLYLLKLLTFVPVPPLYAIKALSLLFDLIIALFAVLIVKRLSPSSSGAVTFALVLAIPTVLVNSSLWGQADSLYTAFILASLYSMLEGRSREAALLFGVAFSLKLQAVFFLPVLLGYLWRRGRLEYAIFAPFVFILCALPAGIGGGSLAYWVGVYFNQATKYPYLSFNAPSVFALFKGFPPEWWHAAATIGIGVAALIALFIFVTIRKRPGEETLMAGSLLSVVLLPFLLPYMHERYFYLADVLAVVYALYASDWKVPFVVIAASFLSYFTYLSQPLPWLGKVIVEEGALAALMGGVGLYLIRRFWPRRRGALQLPISTNIAIH